ncbi:hypothetical protein GOODEAATRI_019610 [Goodea atripinnis]|uniref:Uncharacterized protein n=1 Tax=Goodea atripinnis TaxID=208336 RepID=A0ABV0PQ66_9TELE
MFQLKSVHGLQQSFGGQYERKPLLSDQATFLSLLCGPILMFKPGHPLQLFSTIHKKTAMHCVFWHLTIRTSIIFNNLSHGNSSVGSDHTGQSSLCIGSSVPLCSFLESTFDR